jgi:hypothetical protein
MPTPSPLRPPNPFTPILDQFLLITKGQLPNHASSPQPPFYPGIGYFPMSSLQKQLSQPAHSSPCPASACVTRFSRSSATHCIHDPYRCTRNPATLRGVRHPPSATQRLPLTLPFPPRHVPSPRSPARTTRRDSPSYLESSTYELSLESAPSPWPERATAGIPGNAISEWTHRLSLRLKPCRFGVLLNTRKPACG